MGKNVLKMSYIELSTFNLVYTIFHVCLHPPAFITQGHIDCTLVGNFEKAYSCYTGHSSILIHDLKLIAVNRDTPNFLTLHETKLSLC